MKTVPKVEPNPRPAWAREVAAGGVGGLNVAALRARTADVSALAPFDVEVELADGTRVSAPLVAIDVTPTRMVLRVRLPRALPAEVLGSLHDSAAKTRTIPLAAAG